MLICEVSKKSKNQSAICYASQFAKLQLFSFKNADYKMYYIKCFYQDCLLQTLMIHMTVGEARAPFLCVYYFDLPTSIPTFACIFTVRWLPQIFNRTSFNYQAATWWDLPSYWITVWLIHYGMFVSVCLLKDFILGFLLRQIDIGNQCIWGEKK